MSDYSSNFPQQRPTLNLDFANSGKLDSRISFSRADTPPTYAAPSAVHYWSNEKHLSSLNLLTNSEDFTAWSESNATASANTTAAPDGNTTADTLTGNAGTALKRVQSNSFSADGPTFSFYAKAGTHNYIQIYTNQSSLEYVNFDLTSGSGAVGNAGSLATGAIQAVGSTGWYRCLVKVARNAANFTVAVALVDSTSAAYGATTSSTGTVHLWGAMANDLGDLTNVVAYQSSGSQIHRSFAPTLKSVSNAGDPRFEYDPTDGQSVGSGTALGLLVEAQATNLTKYSEDFSSWGGLSTVAVTSNAGVAPSGQLAADLLVSPSTAAAHYILDSTIAFTSGTKYTASVYVKSAGHRYVQLCGNTSAFGASPYQWVNYDLEAGTLSANNCSGTITAVGNGYYRITATMTATVTTTQSFIMMFADSLSSGFFPTTTGNNYSGFLAYGFQTEVGSAASSLISTSGAAATRASDSCSVATADFGFAGGPVSVYADANAGAGSYPAVFGLSKSADVIRLYRNNSAATDQTDLVFSVRVNNVPEVSNTVSGSANVSKIAIRADTNNSAIKVSGLTQQSDTSCTMPVPDTLEIGDAYGVGQLNGTIRNLMLWNVALSDTELAALVD